MHLLCCRPRPQALKLLSSDAVVQDDLIQGDATSLMLHLLAWVPEDHSSQPPSRFTTPTPSAPATPRGALTSRIGSRGSVLESVASGLQSPIATQSPYIMGGRTGRPAGVPALSVARTGSPSAGNPSTPRASGTEVGSDGGSSATRRYQHSLNFGIPRSLDSPQRPRPYASCSELAGAVAFKPVPEVCVSPRKHNGVSSSSPRSRAASLPASPRFGPPQTSPSSAVTQGRPLTPGRSMSGRSMSGRSIAASGSSSRGILLQVGRPQSACGSLVCVCCKVLRL